MVRGGNPIENLFLIDGIEVPNINHISTVASTGGLVSMIDTSVLQKIDIHTGGYDARYDERLSSVVDIHTREAEGLNKHGDIDVGFVGAGGLFEYPLKRRGSLLLSAHRSLLNLFTNNIGLDGVPIYTNTFASAKINVTSKDYINALSIGGFDSINIKPCSGDWLETNPIDTQYSGWRTTNGVKWQHVYSGSLESIVTLADSEQYQDIDQEDQTLSPIYSQIQVTSCNMYGDINIYHEHTLDGQSTIKYDTNITTKKVDIAVGALARLFRINYNVIQPIGQLSPLSPSQLRSDSDSFSPDFMSGETAGYCQVTFHITNTWNIGAGGRFQTFALGGKAAVTSRLSTIYRISKFASICSSFGQYAQMPLPIYIVSYQQNRGLSPIYARHILSDPICLTIILSG